MRRDHARLAAWSPGVVLGLRVTASVLLVLTGLAVWVVGFLSLGFADDGQGAAPPGRTLVLLSLIDAVVCLALLLGVWRLPAWFSCVMFACPLVLIGLLGWLSF